MAISALDMPVPTSRRISTWRSVRPAGFLRVLGSGRPGGRLTPSSRSRRRARLPAGTAPRASRLPSASRVGSACPDSRSSSAPLIGVADLLPQLCGRLPVAGDAGGVAVGAAGEVVGRKAEPAQVAHQLTALGEHAAPVGPLEKQLRERRRAFGLAGQPGVLDAGKAHGHRPLERVGPACVVTPELEERRGVGMALTNADPRQERHRLAPDHAGVASLVDQLGEAGGRLVPLPVHREEPEASSGAHVGVDREVPVPHVVLGRREVSLGLVEIVEPPQPLDEVVVAAQDVLLVVEASGELDALQQLGLTDAVAELQPCGPAVVVTQRREPAQPESLGQVDGLRAGRAGPPPRRRAARAAHRC